MSSSNSGAAVLAESNSSPTTMAASAADSGIEGLNESKHKPFVDKILHILSIYPKLSPSMLQMGIGGNQSPRKWHPALDELVANGRVRREVVEKMSPAGRMQRYVVLSLA